MMVPREWIVQCTKYVLELNMNMGNYSLTNHFFVVDVLNTNMVLGV